MDWDIMLITTLRAYQMTYKMTIQYTPFELVYDTQPIMLIKFVVPIKIVRDSPQDDLDKAIKVRMQDLIRLDETHWQAGKNINHIQLLCK